MPTSSIDDLLLGGGTASTSTSSEDSYAVQPENAIHDEASTNEDNSTVERGTIAPENEFHEDAQESAENASDGTAHAASSGETDEYGNAKAAARTYSEDEVNERINQAIRDRLARGRHNDGFNQQAVPQQVQQAVQQNANAIEPWEQQLDAVIDQRLSTREQQRAQQIYQQQEAQRTYEFEQRFIQNESQFSDFGSVVKGENITPTMMVATRAMQNPASFLYSASKNHPQELERISKLADPYAQMVEIGRLDMQMKKQKPITQAPRPVTRGQDDAGQKIAPKFKEPTIEDLMMAAENKKRAMYNARRR